jgi:DNA helicase II / ATP-dependent DNA helicase PcrA
MSGNTEMENDEGVQEERRLMYVAMTRATDYLHLSWSKNRRGETSLHSRFLNEIPDSHF